MGVGRGEEGSAKGRKVVRRRWAMVFLLLFLLELSLSQGFFSSTASPLRTTVSPRREGISGSSPANSSVSSEDTAACTDLNVARWVSRSGAWMAVERLRSVRARMPGVSASNASTVGLLPFWGVVEGE